MVFDSLTFRENQIHSTYKTQKRKLEYLQQESATHQNVVGFDVSMQNVAAFEQFESQE